MNPLIVGGILKNFYQDFSMSNFSDRLKLQKLVYLLKHKDMNLGYSFNLYLYGPYSRSLTKDAYQMDQFKEFRDINKVKPASEDQKTKFERFLEKIEEHKNDDKWLEIVSSYFFIKNNKIADTEEDIIKEIMNKRDNIDFGEEKIRYTLKEVKKDKYWCNDEA